MLEPKISIITANYNGAKHLTKAIKSITSQTYRNTEYIIIDGGSTDESLGIIDQHSLNISQVISEQDDGIADAMNKGVSAATGDYILFIHSDDYLISDNSIEHAVKFFDDTHDIFAFSIQHGDESSHKTIMPFGFTNWINIKFSLPHQGIFCSRELFHSIGKFNSKYKICMDYDFFLRAFKKGARAKCNKLTISFMNNAGASSSKLKRLAEEKIVQSDNCDTFILKCFYFAYWPAYSAYISMKMLLKSTDF